ncbi:MAG TPA: peptide-methionine (S)-S-oxide reductase MsrA [Halanaerobiales bacterium]|nr:peptide-methionine (S)-S-oxide reductase MsrA [Halanaerobiales bacterium]
MNTFYILLISLLLVFTVSKVGMAAEETEKPPIDKMRPDNLKTATFAMGCFWGPDVVFGGVEGVWKTRVGYAGGDKENPTYHNLGGHTETIQIEYDPTAISYKELLEIFFENHNPYVKPYSTQYKSIVFYHNQNQKEIYQNYVEKLKENKTLYTQLKEYDKFYYAEFYHQKYQLQGFSRLMKEVQKYYPKDMNFINSTLTARLNYFVGTREGKEMLEKEKEYYGLDEETISWLKSFIKE